MIDTTREPIDGRACDVRNGAARDRAAGVVIRPRWVRPIVRAGWRRPTAVAGEVPAQDRLTSDRPIAAEVPKEARPMFAQSHVVENDLLGAFPALLLLLVLVLTALGVVAHASFA